MTRTAAKAPTVRPRSRALVVDGPVTNPANDDRSNSRLLEQKLTPLLRDYAQANAAKNSGTTAERKAKDALNKALVEEGQTEFSATVQVGENFVRFEAKIAEKDEEFIDPAKVLKHVGSIENFLKVASVTKEKMKEVFGENAVIKCTSKRTKPAALSIEKIK